MEPNKLEQEFKDKLEQRTIEPSAMAWDRLDAMLSVSEKKKQPKRRTWMYIAASFLGFLLVGAILLKQEKENTGNTIETTVVDVEQPAKSRAAQPAQYNDIEGATETTLTPFKQEAVAVNKNGKTVKKTFGTERAYNTTEQHNVVLPVANSINEAVAAVQEVQETQDKGAKELLAASMHDNPAKKKSSIKVNPSSLLSSVESELDNSFRSEVLQKVVKNYNTVKTSVANRNYQYK
jgi:hypothetical protein